MKLYTEEQVKEMLNKINSVLPKRASLLVYMVENITEYMNPIELPSDEEVEEESQNKTRVDFGYYLRITWVEGAKWMKEQILNQNIPELRNADGTYGQWGTSGINNQNKAETLEEWKSKFSHHCVIKPKTNT